MKLITARDGTLLEKASRFYGPYLILSALISASESKGVLDFMFKMLKTTFSTVLNSVYTRFTILTQQRCNKIPAVPTSISDTANYEDNKMIMSMQKQIYYMIPIGDKIYVIIYVYECLISYDLHVINYF